MRALARLWLPTPCNDYLRALAVEAARRIIDHNRVRDAHQDIYLELYARWGDALDSPLPERLLLERGGLPKIAASDFVSSHFGRIQLPSISDLAKQLDKLARYDRKTLSARERALAELDRAIERS